MKGSGKGLIYLASAGMELSWLYAWADFLLKSAFQRAYPFWGAVLGFGLGMALTFLSRGRGWRIISMIIIQFSGVLFALSWIVHDFYQPLLPFLSQSWITAFLSRTLSPLEWLMMSLALFCTILFWLSGVMLARRSMDYSDVCARFDLGVGAILFLLLIELVSYVKVNAGFDYAITEPLMFPFFVFALLALGLARNRGGGKKSFASGFGGLGIVLSFSGTVLLFCTGAVLLSRPYLTRGAEIGYDVMKSAATPLIPILVKVLRFIFLSRSMRTDPQSPANQDQIQVMMPTAGKGGWPARLEEILLWTFVVIAGLILTILILFLLWRLLRWLFSRSPSYKQEKISFNLIFNFLTRVLRLVHRCYLWAGIRRGQTMAIDLYERLLKWGTHSGLPRIGSETPNEYASRLGKFFPVLEKEISGIVGAVNREIYGQMILDDYQMTEIRSFWTQLRSPLYWPARMRVRAFNHRD